MKYFSLNIIKTNLFIFGLLFPISLFAQNNYKECQVIQTSTKDTTKKHISLIQKYDENGNLIYEYRVFL